MFGNCRLAYGERLGELGDRRVAGGEAGEDGVEVLGLSHCITMWFCTEAVFRQEQKLKAAA